MNAVVMSLPGGLSVHSLTLDEPTMRHVYRLIDVDGTELGDFGSLVELINYLDTTRTV